MPHLKDVKYSRQDCTDAISDFYSFLTALYLDEDSIKTPPPEGWPQITSSNLTPLDKTDEVVNLLRHLHCIQPRGSDPQQCAPRTEFADWAQLAASLVAGHQSAYDVKVLTEGEWCDDVPSHVIGLTCGGRGTQSFLLDVQLGVIYWPECPGEISESPECPEAIFDSSSDYAPGNERNWRGGGGGGLRGRDCAWAVKDFFEMLKYHFRQLNFIPMNDYGVKDIWTLNCNQHQAMREMIQQIYRDHGWPDLQSYRKRECLDAIYNALLQHFPDYA